jgi:hypothetical protein
LLQRFVARIKGISSYTFEANSLELCRELSNIVVPDLARPVMKI